MYLRGGAEINGNGEFRVFINRPDGTRAYMISEAMLAWLRPHYEFLMSRDTHRVVCGVPLEKTVTSRKGMPQIFFRSGDDIMYAMIRSARGGFAIFSMTLPFETPEDIEDNFGSVQNNVDGHEGAV